MNFDFEKFYRTDPDPWNFAGSDYECNRYQAIVEGLPRRRYTRAFEPGCSIGELTARLATLCDRVIATDIAPSAVALARKRCCELSHVDIGVGDLGGEIPVGPFDLIIFSEIGYYFSPQRLLGIGASLARRLCRGGDFVAAHWLGESADHVLHGDVVHDELIAHLPLCWQGGERHAGFRIDTWRQA